MAYPYNIPAGFLFNVKIAGITGDGECSFQEVSGLNATLETETINEGGLNEYVHKLPKRVKYDNLVLKRGLLIGSPLITWINTALGNYQFSPKQVDIELLDGEGEPLVTWSLANAYPVSVKMGGFNAKENALAVETLELAYSSFSRTG